MTHHNRTKERTTWFLRDELIFFISDGICQYIIEEKHERSQALLNPLYIKRGK
jgi:hypothetical protein